MTQISALPVATNAVGTADIFVLDQIESGTLTTTQVSAFSVRTFMQANLGSAAYEAVPAAGLVFSTGTHLEDGTIGTGLSLDLSTGSLRNSGVVQFGTDVGTITIALPLTQVGGTLNLRIGDGLTVGSGTLFNDGVISFGGDTGSIVVGSGLLEASKTLTNAGVLAIGTIVGDVTLGTGLSTSGNTLNVTSSGTGTVTSVIAGLGLAGGTITSAGTITLDVATTAALGGVIAGANTTINAGGTISVATPGTGTVTSVVAGTGLGGGTITGSGTLTNAGVIQFGTDIGTIHIGAGLSEASSTLSNTGVLAVGSTAGSIVLGTNLSVSGQTLNASSGVAAPGAGLVVSNGTTLADAVLVGLTLLSGTTLEPNPAARVLVNSGTVAATGSTTISTDCSTGNVFTNTMTATATLANPTNVLAGATYMWLLNTGTSGATTLALGSAFLFNSPYSNASPPSLGPGLNVLTAVAAGTATLLSVMQPGTFS